jgi:hypothetical protein
LGFGENIAYHLGMRHHGCSNGLSQRRILLDRRAWFEGGWEAVAVSFSAKTVPRYYIAQLQGATGIFGELYRLK